MENIETVWEVGEVISPLLLQYRLEFYRKKEKTIVFILCRSPV